MKRLEQDRERVERANEEEYVAVLKLTFHVPGSPGAQCCLGERVPSWLSGDSCAEPPCRMINLHNDEYICSRDSQSHLQESSNRSSVRVNKHLFREFD